MARLTPYHLLPALIAAASQAGELTIEKRPFSITRSFVTTALPTHGCTLVKLDPKAWKSFEITSIAPHAAAVKKGDLLVAFDATELRLRTEGVRRDWEAGKLALAQAELEFQMLQDSAPAKLESLRQAAAAAREENAYFTRTRRKAGEDQAARDLKSAEQQLANQREELRQLSKLAKDDAAQPAGGTVLARHQDAVAAAEFALSMEVLDHKRTLEVVLPREGRLLADNERDTSMALKKAEAGLPRSIEAAKIELAGRRAGVEQTRKLLAELEADQTLLEQRAPDDGWFYHGAIEDGRWILAEPEAELAARHPAPLHQAFATFIPASSKLVMVSFLDDATARALAPEQAGTATLPGREDLELPVKLAALATVPAPDGTYRADFSVTWPEGVTPVSGSLARIDVVSYQTSAAMVVPNRALEFGPGGWTVAVKLADGKTEHRLVKRGRVGTDETEIVSGLEIGQVVIVPAA